MSDQLHWIKKLNEVSPSARGVCSSAAYLQTTAGAEIENILSICIEAADMDLRNMGFFINKEILPESMEEMADQTGIFLYVFRQEFFDSLFLEEHEKLDQLKNFDFSTIEDEDNRFIVFLEFMQHLFPNISGFKRMQTILGELDFRYNSTFITMIEELIEKIPYKDVFQIEENLERINAFVNIMNNNRKAYKRCVNIALNAYPELNKDYLLHSIQTYDLEKIQPGNVNTFAWMMLENDATLPKLQKEFKAKRLQEHEESNSHHAEYYYAHPEFNIGKEQIVELVSHHIEPMDTPKSMFSNIVNMFRKDWELTKSKDNLHKSLFSKEYVEFGKQLIPLFLDQYTEEQINEAFGFITN